MSAAQPRLQSPGCATGTSHGIRGSFDWDHVALKATGNSKAEHYLRSPFRTGWEV